MESLIVLTLTLSLLAFPHQVLGDDTNGHSEAPPFVCRKRSLDFGPKRHLYFNGQSIPIVIETSERPSHQLASHILRILLTEVLGYDDVRVVHGYNTINTSVILNRLAGCWETGCTGYHANTIPDTMVNIELWTEAGFNMKPWVQHDLVNDLGPLGPTGRFGWFVPTATVNNMWKTQNIIVDHWRAFQNDIVTRLFSLGDAEDELRNLLENDDDLTNASVAGCKDDNPEVKCARLLSSFPDLDMGLLHTQVHSLVLNVSVLWLKSHLSHFVQDRTSQGLATLFFSWIPNTLTLINNYTRVALPVCQKSHQQPTNCDFEVNQMSKVVWPAIKTHAPEAYHVIRNMKFTQDQYEDLLKLYVDNNPDFTVHPEKESFQRTACQWISENLDLWVPWLPSNLTSKRKIYLGAMFPITGPFWRLPGVVPGAVLAQEHINQDERYLSNYDISLVIKDTQCKTDIAMKEFMHLVVNETHPIVGILGPGCTEVAENVAGISTHFNRIVVSYSAEALQLADRDSFPLFFRTVPPITQNGAVLVDIFNTFGWSQVALLAEVGEFPEYHHYLQDKFLSSDIDVVLQRNIPRQSTMEDADKYLDELASSGAKIVILTSFEVSGRAIICQAHKKKMTSVEGYVWFLPHWFTKDWWNTDEFNIYYAEEIPCSTADMLWALDGYFTMSSAVYGDPNSTTMANTTVSQWKQQYEDKLHKLDLSNYQSPYASYAYDAVWVFALALDRLLKDDPSALETITTDQTTSRLMYHMNKTNFLGVSGPLQFSGADRTGIINIHQHRKNRSTLVGKYYPSQQSVRLNTNAIFWVNGELPTDGKTGALEDTCGIEVFRDLLGVSCDMAIVVANILAFGSFIVCLLLVILVIKFRYDRKVKATRERMEELGLMQDSNILSLDEWELPREKVVLNRKLGQGAFGTVYGGEAYIEESWCAVAIKTLKVGSSSEEKVDFLCEAEMMKRFTHTNIVKLLGVCTRGEPAYTVMEFMLFGDLKTFLLDRRHLADKENREIHDVSTIMLTKYALDVASGLNYLNSMKYVHRDLACRNCLVHASKTVKISDFGMTRHTYETDYYRFNRKGMLPVRWMAPESLTDGMFTSSSDVWAYGILLYEIMTLGGFPYQGMSNNQVLEFVREGNTIGLPTSTSQYLKDLIQACWSFEPTHRPQISNIVRTLSNNPPLIEPCLEAPLLPLIDEVREYEELQRFRVKLRKKSNVTSSQFKQISSLDRLPLKKSQSHASLINGSLFYWVGDFLRKDGKKRKTSSPLEDTLHVTEPLTNNRVALPRSTSCLASANHIEYNNENASVTLLCKSQTVPLVKDPQCITEAILPER